MLVCTHESVTCLKRLWWTQRKGQIKTIAQRPIHSSRCLPQRLTKSFHIHPQTLRRAPVIQFVPPSKVGRNHLPNFLGINKVPLNFQPYPSTNTYVLSTMVTWTHFFSRFWFLRKHKSTSFTKLVEHLIRNLKFAGPTLQVPIWTYFLVWLSQVIHPIREKKNCEYPNPRLSHPVDNTHSRE